MPKTLVYVALAAVGLLSCGPKSAANPDADKGRIKIGWVDTVVGDFSFHGTWDYPEGVYKNEFGQLSCDGLCPEGIDAMQDSSGRIYRDSLRAFYRLVDTTHRFHSIQCDAWCYEWSGTDFITAKRRGRDSVECATEMNAATHCRLHLDIVDSICYPRIDLISVVPNGSTSYRCTGGFLKIERPSWERGVLKAEFSFTFRHTEDPEKPMYWKGRTYALVE
jgi:hypothetical protein